MIEYLPIVLTGIGLTASILYYSINLRNANQTQQMQLETRQLQLFMNINESRGSPEFQKLIYRVTFVDDWSSIDDYFTAPGEIGKDHLAAGDNLIVEIDRLLSGMYFKSDLLPYLRDPFTYLLNVNKVSCRRIRST